MHACVKCACEVVMLGEAPCVSVDIVDGDMTVKVVSHLL